MMGMGVLIYTLFSLNRHLFKGKIIIRSFKVLATNTAIDFTLYVGEMHARLMNFLITGTFIKRKHFLGSVTKISVI